MDDKNKKSGYIKYISIEGDAPNTIMFKGNHGVSVLINFNKNRAVIVIDNVKVHTSLDSLIDELYDIEAYDLIYKIRDFIESTYSKENDYELRPKRIKFLHENISLVLEDLNPNNNNFHFRQIYNLQIFDFDYDKKYSIHVNTNTIFNLNVINLYSNKDYCDFYNFCLLSTDYFYKQNDVINTDSNVDIKTHGNVMEIKLTPSNTKIKFVYKINFNVVASFMSLKSSISNIRYTI